MKVHIYNNSYIVKNDYCELFLSEEQFAILSVAIKENNIENIINCLIGEQTIDNTSFSIVKKNIESFIQSFEEKYQGKVFGEAIFLTGELNKFYPRVLNIELTNYCNLYCGHCYKDAGNKNNIFLEFEIIKLICEKYKGKIQVINLTGGEPLSHPKINEIIDILYAAGFNINITTNGTLYEKIKERIDKINNFQISVYGYDENTYLKTTMRRGFYKMNSFIRFLEREKKEFTISFLANKLYLDNINEYNDYLSRIKAKQKILGTADLQGRCDKNGIWYLTSNEKEHIYSLLEKIDGYSFPEEDDPSHCQAGTLVYTLNEHGNFILCHALNSKAFEIGTFDEIEKRFINNNFNMYEYARKYRKFLGAMCKYSED